MCSWNVAGVERKNKEFFKGLEQWEVIVMLETWLDEKGWGRIRNRLPKGYKWEVQNASRKKRKAGLWEEC